MRIAMIGTGYVGLVSGACFAEFGVEVTCVDKAVDKIAMLESGRIPIYEPGLEDLVARHRSAGRLRFTTELAPALDGADAIFIAVGTPTRRGDGHADLSYVFAAAEEIARGLDHPALVVTKSTVPVGTGRRLKRLFRELRPDLPIDVASNPEFLREGSAIEDFLRPDRVVCGVETDAARDTLAALYRPLNLIETPILFTTIETAELIKYATNSFLATKITFINEIADLCEKVGADVQQVARGIGLDGRIGRKFLHAGPGYGGPPADRRTARGAAADRRHGRAGQRGPQAADGQEDRGRHGRRDRRSADRGPGRHLQAQHGRHAREPEPRDRTRLAGRGRGDPGLRSRGPARG
jgi:UDPglucose 6-dehydrogenase